MICYEVYYCDVVNCSDHRVFIYADCISNVIDILRNDIGFIEIYDIQVNLKR